MATAYLHNNSGGDDWMSQADWMILQDNGWTLHELFPGRIHAATTDLPRFAAEAEWKSLLNKDPDVLGCGCCGRPHQFREVEDATSPY